MAITIDMLINEHRVPGDKLLNFLLYLPIGLILFTLRIVLILVLWIASIILPKKSSFSHLLSILACFTFGVYVKVTGKRDPRCSVLVANYVSVLDSLAASHAFGTISLRKWKVPPFFAAALGIRNSAQFVRKEHFADNPEQPILLQPEGGPTNGKGLLEFTDWPFQPGNRVQPVAIKVHRPLTSVTVNAECGWRDAAWFLLSPLTVVSVTVLPSVDRADCRDVLAATLAIPTTPYTWAQLKRTCDRPTPLVGGRQAAVGDRQAGVGDRQAGVGGRQSVDHQQANRVKEVLPDVPLADIVRDLAQTHNVDVTITNFLEGITPYTPERQSEPQPSTSHTPPPSHYVTPTPVAIFPKSAKERQISFQERKAQMIATARQKYIEKHGLNVA